MQPYGRSPSLPTASGDAGGPKSCQKLTLMPAESRRIKRIIWQAGGQVVRNDTGGGVAKERGQLKVAWCRFAGMRAIHRERCQGLFRGTKKQRGAARRG